MNFPTEQQGREYFQQYKVPQNILEHCLKVRAIAVFIAEKLQQSGETVNLPLVNCLAFLHDLFKMASIDKLGPNKYHSYQHSPEEIAMWQELRKKYAGLHESEIAYSFFKEEYPEFALTLKNSSNPEKRNKTIEEMIVHYSDWRVLGAKVVSLQERRKYLFDFYALPPSKKWDDDFQEILDFEQKLIKQEIKI